MEHYTYILDRAEIDQTYKKHAFFPHIFQKNRLKVKISKSS